MLQPMPAGPARRPLRDAVAARFEMGLAKVDQDHADFAAIICVDGSGRIQDSDPVLKRQTGSRSDLRLEIGRQRMPVGMSAARLL